MSNFDNYLSPFSWRYGSREMRELWSEVYKRRQWRKIWLALAETQADYDLVTDEQVAELRAHVASVDISRSLEIEADIHHDLMAELKAYAEQCPEGGKVLHLGATSMDIEDNAEALRLRQATDLVIRSVSSLLRYFAELIERWAETPIMAFTHLQPAEPSTLGYRLAQYAQDLFEDYQGLVHIRETLRGKGFKGAVGTSAAYGELLGVEQLEEFEKRLSSRLDLPFYPVTTQVYPRKQEYTLISALAGLAGSLYKLAFDLRLLQSPAWGEASEPFGERQVGSSAMPFKRNPINAEKIDSLGRALAQMPRLAWDNAAHSLLERTLDDSANRRTLLPEAFLISDELLITSTKIVKGLQVDEVAVARNLANYAPFAATERILMGLSKKGADRQVVHERLRILALEAWEAVRLGVPNPLKDLVCKEKEFLQYYPEDELRGLMDAAGYVGDAPSRARALAQTIRQYLNHTQVPTQLN
jgi:adenylosuccinate lyase